MKNKIKQLSFCGSLCFLAAFWGCSSSEDVSGGTASEGESFIYGTLEDSTGTTLSNTEVILARVSITEDGAETSSEDTTFTDSTGRFEFRPEQEGDYVLSAKQKRNDTISINSIVSGIHWSPTFKDSVLKIEGLPLLPPIKVTGSVLGMDFCSKDPIHIFVPGTPAKAILAKDGKFMLPPIPSGQLELGVLCDDAVQFIPLYLPKGCKMIHLEGLPLRKPEEFSENAYTPYPTEQKHSVATGVPPKGLGDGCPDGASGPDGPHPWRQPPPPPPK